MMKQMQKSVLALIVLGATALPAMAASVDIKVIGTILPAGCTPTLSGGGIVDYKQINSSRLSKTGYTVLPLHQLDFSIHCEAATKVAIKAIEGRPDSAAGTSGGYDGVGIAPVNIFDGPEMFVAGLNRDNGSRVGGYGIRINSDTVIADSQKVDSIASSDEGSSWRPAASGQLYNAFGPHYQSWAAAGTSVPVAFETLTGKLEVQAYLNMASQLDLTRPIVLDGLTTIELVYL